MDPLTHLMIAYSFVFIPHKLDKIPNKFLIPYLIGSIIPDVDLIFNGLVYFVPKLCY